MVTLLAPVVSKPPTYVKVANFPCLYRHNRSGRYYACKKVAGRRKEHSQKTCDRKMAKRRLKKWIGNLEKVDAEAEKTSIGHLATGRGREAAGHTDKVNQRVHRRIRAGGGVFCFETQDQEQDGFCVHETILPNV